MSRPSRTNWICFLVRIHAIVLCMTSALLQRVGLLVAEWADPAILALARIVKGVTVTVGGAWLVSRNTMSPPGRLLSEELTYQSRMAVAALPTATRRVR